MNRTFVLRALGSAILVLGLAAPAIAVDTGGGDSGSSGSSSGPAVPALSDARADIKAERWTAAIEKLRLIVDADGTNADAYNLLGYALRHTGATDRAMQAYNRALKLNPKHTGALEYQGELFVILGDKGKATANLKKIEAICGTTCEEYEDLAKAIEG